LINQGYAAFSQAIMDERKLADLPPYTFMAIVRAEAISMNEPHQFLLQVADVLGNLQGCAVDVLGPAPAPMERLGGRYRAQLLLQSDRRSSLHAALQHLTNQIDDLPKARRCRWSIDVDPVDLY
jgi:primosomal protein N' (replication factor Y)